MKEAFDDHLSDKIRAEMQSFQPEYNPAHWEDLRQKMHGPKPVIKIALLVAVLTLFACLPPYPLNQGKYLPTWPTTATRTAFLAELVTDSLGQREQMGATAERTAPVGNTAVPTNRTPSLEAAPNREELAASNSNNVKIKPASAKLPPTGRGPVAGDLLPIAEEPQQQGTFTDGRLANEQLGASIPEIWVLPPKPVVPLAMRLQAPQADTSRFTLQEYTRQKQWQVDVFGTALLNRNGRIGYTHLGSSWGVHIERKIGKRMRVYSGMALAFQGAKNLPDQLDFTEPYIPATLNSFNQRDEFFFNRNLIDIAGLASESQVELVTQEGRFISLELPLGFRYALSAKPKQRWWVGAEFTSFLQLHERYFFEEELFEVLVPNIAPRVAVQEREISYGAFQSFDPLAQLRLGVLWEYEFGKQQQIGIEPFLGIPLRGMGVQQVWSFSHGLRLRYRIGQR